jgi:hypothetical protein
MCQFGVMFFPDKQASFNESLRVLAPGGTYLFVLWVDYTKMTDSPLWIAAQTVGDLLRCDPHTLLNPGYFDEPTIRADLSAAGFRDVRVDRISRTARATSARNAAVILIGQTCWSPQTHREHRSRITSRCSEVGCCNLERISLVQILEAVRREVAVDKHAMLLIGSAIVAVLFIAYMMLGVVGILVPR